MTKPIPTCEKNMENVWVGKVCIKAILKASLTSAPMFVKPLGTCHFK